MEELKKQEVQEIVVTADEQELVFKGIRPEGMNFQVYRKVRSDLNKTVKLYLGGKIVFKSKRLFVTSEINKAKKEGVDLTAIKGKTYRKESAKKTEVVHEETVV